MTTHPSLPQKFQDEEVAIELNADFPILSGHITRFTEQYIVLEGDKREYVIPWSSIGYLWIAKKQEETKNGTR